MKAPETRPAALGARQNSSAQFGHRSAGTNLAQRKEDNVDADIPNIVLLGQTGVGKSSIINLIAGQKIADTSNNTLGCTFQHQRHTVTVNGTSCALWDTTGLGEGDKGTVPAVDAESDLRSLIQRLAHTGGINLVIYCIRASSSRMADLQRNYKLFYVGVCPKVPVALVVTGLEHQEGEMETWWDDNKEALREHKMRFDVHECVTTLDADDDVVQKRRSDSQRRLRELVVRYSKSEAWKTQPSFIPWVFGNVFRAGKQWFVTAVEKVRSATRRGQCQS